jgi:hypothetical protein
MIQRELNQYTHLSQGAINQYIKVIITCAYLKTPLYVPTTSKLRTDLLVNQAMQKKQGVK